MSLPATYFDELYRESPDPWGLATRRYEARKYAITLAALPLQRYRRAFEPGCSIGVLTRMLATRADTVVAMDVSEAALARAAEGVPGNVALTLGAAPRDWPDGRFDLIVFSELGYYFEQADLDAFVEQALSSLEPDGHLVACHWRAPVADYPADAESVHATLAGSPFERLARYADDHFLLEVFGHVGAKLVGPEEPRRTDAGVSLPAPGEGYGQSSQAPGGAYTGLYENPRAAPIALHAAHQRVPSPNRTTSRRTLAALS